MLSVTIIALFDLPYSWFAHDVIKIQKSKLYVHPTKLFLTWYKHVCTL